MCWIFMKFVVNWKLLKHWTIYSVRFEDVSEVLRKIQVFWGVFLITWQNVTDVLLAYIISVFVDEQSKKSLTHLLQFLVVLGNF